MFAKPYKHKSNNTLKNSEKKHLAQRVQEEFGLVSEEKAKELIPAKGNCVCLKIVLHSGESVNVYVVDNAPMLIETDAGLVPTVCALWKVPELVPTLDIHNVVLRKVQGGAPLYLPGVRLPAQGRGFPQFRAGAALAARTEDNAAACLVGRAALSSADMLFRPQGVCLETLHVYGDQLCKDPKFGKIERPVLPPAIQDYSLQCLAGDIQQISLQPEREAWPALGRPAPAAPAAPAPAPAPPNEPRVIPAGAADPADGDDAADSADESLMTDSSVVEDDIPEDMDGLLRWCLLCFLKLEGKQVELPLLTNLLYKNHLHPLCPEGRTLDVKKSSYKKLTKFLEAMQQEGLLEVRELERGVSALAGVCAQHALVRAHRVPAGLRARLAARRAPAPAPGDYAPPAVREMFCVTANVQELLAPIKKGTALTAAELRAAVTEYVRARGLSSAERRGAVVLDAALARAAGRPEQEPLRWEQLMPAVQARMTAATELRHADGSVALSKARLEPVTMQVAMRSGNKKVTLVSNLEQFGFSLPALAHACQVGVAATCGVTRAPGAKRDQLMLQGDQTYFVAKLLIEKYGLPKKFIDGADKALNKKPK